MVVLLDLHPYEAGRSRLLLSLVIAELAGIAASVAVVILLTRRSIRPLSEALALQRRFVADASHELRAPLTVLHTRVQMLARRFEDGDAHAAKNQIDALTADTRALGAVIEDLLASASMTVDGAPRDQVDLAESRTLFTKYVPACRIEGSALGRGARRRQLAHGFVVLGSTSALRRAIASLVDNALAHQHPGGTITIRVRRDGDRVMTDVQDNGVGIAPDAMGSLFERFSHGHSNTGTTGPRRYGIGLSLVREIAHAHHGDISVAQTPGGGATFTLTLPAAN